jgi:hypothetical protein
MQAVSGKLCYILLSKIDTLWIELFQKLAIESGGKRMIGAFRLYMILCRHPCNDKSIECRFVKRLRKTYVRPKKECQHQYF